MYLHNGHNYITIEQIAKLNREEVNSTYSCFQCTSLRYCLHSVEPRLQHGNSVQAVENGLLATSRSRLEADGYPLCVKDLVEDETFIFGSGE